MLRSRWMLLTGVLVALPVAVEAQTADTPQIGDPQAGLEIARHSCSSCHAVGRGEVLSPVSRASAFEDIADKQAVTGMSLTAFLRTPHVTMPDLILRPDEISDVVAYILSLKD